MSREQVVTYTLTCDDCEVSDTYEGQSKELTDWLIARKRMGWTDTGKRHSCGMALSHVDHCPKCSRKKGLS